MPELPEAETILRGLRPHLPGRTIRRVEIFHDDLLVGPAEALASRLTGSRIRGVGRRGKNLVLALEPGRAESAGRPGKAPGGSEPAEPLRLVVNLGMSGRLLLRSPDRAAPAASHPGVILHLDREEALVYHDVRRFGRLTLLSGPKYARWSDGLGPEPLEGGFTGRRLAEGLAASASPVRSWLLDQRRVAGVGNIYANEALHRARVHPRTPAREVGGQGARRLHRALRRVLREAIRARGTTLRDYRTAGGAEGSYEGLLRVYGREGRPCPRCRTPVERTVFGGRSAFLCPRCQPEPTR